MNQELFKKIHDVIKVNPYRLEMSSWEGAACGTTRCVAGWAIHLTTGEPLFDARNEDHHPSVKALAVSLGAQDDFEDIGATLLGLEGREADLFYTDNETAETFVRLTAEGKEAEARRVLNEWAQEH